MAPSPGPCHALHASVILFDARVHIGDLPDDECRARLDIIVSRSGGMGLTAVNHDLVRPVVAADRLGEEAHGRRFVPMCCEQNIDGVPARLHGTIGIIAVALDADRCVVQAPAEPWGSLAGVKGLLQMRTHLHDSPVDSLVIDRHGAFLHQCLESGDAHWISPQTSVRPL